MGWISLMRQRTQCEESIGRLASCRGSGGPREEDILTETRQDGKGAELVHLAETPALAFALPSFSHVLQRLVWPLVHLVLAGGSIPVSATLHIHSPSLSFPSSQVIENTRRQSVEGLALPFLLNWLLGMIDTPRVVD